MSVKRNHVPRVKQCKCSACEVEANAPPGKRHRKCKGKAGDVKAKGTWE